jgi:hypothetical protein
VDGIVLLIIRGSITSKFENYYKRRKAILISRESAYHKGYPTYGVIFSYRERETLFSKFENW